MTTQLRGITWEHTRGLLPMQATAQRFRETHPEVRIEWQVRSLQEFADLSLGGLANRYDLLVIDHPSCGEAAEEKILTPLDEWMSADFLAGQAANSIGGSWESYVYGGHPWALAIDAAAPVSGWRRDLLQRAGAIPPESWDDLLALARRGLVAIPGVPTDVLMHFYMFCIATGGVPFSGTESVIEEETGIRALEMLRELMTLCHPGCLSMDPIAVWEMMASGDSVAYCPFAYGYSNYSRPRYAPHVLTTGNLVRLPGGQVLRSTLGGAGLAIAAACPHKQIAAEYACYVAGEACQTTLYFDSGGQPGHAGAWRNEEVNRRSNCFFANTIGTVQNAYVRPRFRGYREFQEKAGLLVHDFLTSGRSAKASVSAINQLLPSSARKEQARCV